MESNCLSEEAQLDYAFKNLELLLEWNGRYDNKLSIILGISIAMLGFLVSSAPIFTKWTGTIYLSFFSSIVAIAVSFALIYLGSTPRLPGPEKSLWYFNSICQIKYPDFEKTYLNRNFNEHIKDILQQCHRNSEILSMKFNYLRHAYISLLISAAIWSVTILLFRQ